MYLGMLFVHKLSLHHGSAQQRTIAWQTLTAVADLSTYNGKQSARSIPTYTKDDIKTAAGHEFLIEAGLDAAQNDM